MYASNVFPGVYFHLQHLLMIPSVTRNSRDIVTFREMPNEARLRCLSQIAETFIFILQVIGMLPVHSVISSNVLKLLFSRSVS